jgi:hypothetical protein
MFREYRLRAFDGDPRIPDIIGKNDNHGTMAALTEAAAVVDADRVLHPRPCD